MVRKLRLNSGTKKTTASKTRVKSKGGKKSKSSVAQGFRTAERVNARIQKEREIRNAQPLRFRMKAGEERTVIVTDVEPFFMYEHQYETRPGVWAGFDRCRKELGICPACERLEREGAYVMMLTVIDLQPFTKKNGEKVKRSKKLLSVKTSMIPKYKRLFEKNGETFRGMKLKLYRDTNKEPNTGSEVDLVKILTEAEMAKYGDLANPTDYEKAFPMPTENELREKHKTGKPAGSEDIEDDGDAEDVSWEDDED